MTRGYIFNVSNRSMAPPMDDDMMSIALDVTAEKAPIIAPDDASPLPTPLLKLSPTRAPAEEPSTLENADSTAEPRPSNFGETVMYAVPILAPDIQRPPISCY